jgi:phosphatidylinositol N-acetylglucosaminyltransferase subunit A
VKLYGDLPYEEVPDVMRKGSVFLSTSRMESFCMAALEGACCGLYVVATDVGGVKEVLPSRMITLTALGKWCVVFMCMPCLLLR